MIVGRRRCTGTSKRGYPRTAGAVMLAFAMVFLLPAAVEARPIYVYHLNGVTRFTHEPPPPGIAAKVFTAKSSKFSIYRSLERRVPRLFHEEYRTIIRAASDSHGVEESLLRAVIHAESAFNPRAVSPKGALGLMQIMPFNLERLGVRDPFSPQQNIDGGARLLSMLIRKYSGNLRFALAAYNAGEEAVARYGGVPPYRETVQYVERVLSLQRRYSP